MRQSRKLRAGLGALAAIALIGWGAGARAQQPPQHPMDDKLASEPAPWTVPGKWGPRGNWGRWGEQDKRGMLNFITPEMIVKAAGLVKQGKVYPLGEEMYNDLPRVITPSRFGVQVVIENDGYDRATQPGQFDPKRSQGAASYTIMHNHVGTHLDTFAHIYRENALFNNMPPPGRWGPSTAMRPASSSWWAAACCSTSRSSRAWTRSPATTGSPWTI